MWINNNLDEIMENAQVILTLGVRFNRYYLVSYHHSYTYNNVPPLVHLLGVLMFTCIPLRSPGLKATPKSVKLDNRKIPDSSITCSNSLGQPHNSLDTIPGQWHIFSSVTLASYDTWTSNSTETTVSQVACIFGKGRNLGGLMGCLVGKGVGAGVLSVHSHYMGGCWSTKTCFSGTQLTEYWLGFKLIGWLKMSSG